MEIFKQPCGDYQTNCYIVKFESFEIIIDPGVEAISFVQKHCSNPVAILNTHGHFDHIWSNKEVSTFYNIPVYIPKDDNFMLSLEQMPKQPMFEGAKLIEHDEYIMINGIKCTFKHYPGHTPGCSMIEIKQHYFSGDFIFEGSIGRWDFPYSNANDMKTSILKFKEVNNNFDVHPGHGNSTTIQKEQKNILRWLDYI